MAEVLSGGGDGPPARPRRWLVALAVLGLAVSVAAVARSGRSGPPGPSTADSPAPAAALPVQRSVVSVAEGAGWAYALVSECGAQIVHECDYRVHRRDVGGTGWEPTPLHVTGRTTTGLPVRLRVGAGDRVILVDGADSVYSSTGGSTITVAHLRRGPPIAALPVDGILANGLCESCDNTVTVLEPATGQLRPLATQPAFTGYGLRLASADGAVLWAAQVGPPGALTAVSRDGGRTWRPVPLAGGLGRTDPVVLAGIPGGGAYLVGGREDSPLPDVRRVDWPGGSWRRIAPPSGPSSAYSAVVGERGLLVGDGNGQAWRLLPTGRFVQLPGVPGYLASGPARVLLGLPSTPGVVLVSYDEGESWLTEHVTR